MTCTHRLGLAVLKEQFGVNHNTFQVVSISYLPSGVKPRSRYRNYKVRAGVRDTASTKARRVKCSWLKVSLRWYGQENVGQYLDR